MMKMLNLPTYSITTTNITPHVALYRLLRIFTPHRIPLQGNGQLSTHPAPCNSWYGSAIARIRHSE